MTSELPFITAFRAMAQPVIFPITGWKNDLAGIPTVTDQSVREFYQKRSGAQRSYERSYNFHVESYVNVAALMTNRSDTRFDDLFVSVWQVSCDFDL